MTGTWYEQFAGYRHLRSHKLPDLAEVGCGPHTNIRFLIELTSPDVVYLKDPLITAYISLGRGRRVSLRRRQTLLEQIILDPSHRTEISSAPCEALPWRSDYLEE
jgi:hypothetical protein